MPGTSSWWQLQPGIELLSSTRSSSCSAHQNHQDHVHVACGDFDVVGKDDGEEKDHHLNGPLEESFAGLAGENAVVEPGDFVPAHLRPNIISPLVLLLLLLCVLTDRTGRVDELLP